MAPAAIDAAVEGVTDTTSIIMPDPMTIEMIAERRAKGTKIATGIAAFSSSDMFKSPGCFLKPKAKKFDHKLSVESKARYPSKLKGAAKFMKDPNVISLGGGLPSSDYFPFDHFDLSVPAPPTFDQKSETHRIGKHDVRDGKSLYDLHISLNYAQSVGSAQMIRFVTEHTEVIHNPRYSDWECLLSVGSTSALDMSLRMLCERGDCVLTEEYSFSSAVDTMRPLGLKPIGVAMDAEGLLATALDEVLTNWDAEARGGSKPSVLYTVPTGQNPTGATQSTERRKEILAVAQKHDLVILEDEPYYFLQMEPYASTSSEASTETGDHKSFLASLVPSLLSLDTDGRVLRFDSFSKVLAPGTRTGWITGNSQFVERLIRHSEVSVQTAAGTSQVILYRLLEEVWGHSGFIDWLIHIRKEYTRRRNVLVGACEKHLGAAKEKGIATWVPPMAGMFHWVYVDHTKHPLYNELKAAGKSETEIIQKIEDHIFLESIDQGVLVARGSWFKAESDTDHELFFRMTFAAASEEKIIEAIARFGASLAKEFNF